MLGLLTTAVLLDSAPLARALDVVRDGRPVATIVIEGASKSQPNKGSQRARDTEAAKVLIDWVRKMTGAELHIAPTAPTDGPAICLGASALKEGLRLDDIDSPSHEGLRVRLDGQKLLMAGQNDVATTKAVCRLLEHWGCRYLIDHPLGEVYPKTKTLTVEKLDITEKPGFLQRNIWGSMWSGLSLWKIWNGAGGIPFGVGHSWGHYVPRDLFKEHPEYFALREGQRRAGDWYCTSSPGLREVFAKGVMTDIAKGNLYPSLSPPDGIDYCQCDKCRAADDPKVIEPSSGKVCITNRYLDLYRDVAARVAQKYPDAILNFYCYADYTQAPTRGGKLPVNLCPWLAPIRYCRLHPIGQETCATRVQLCDLIDGWSAAATKLGYRTYNYNLAECLVPFSMISVWKHDMPYLKQKGFVGINNETLANWQIYGPHMYLSVRLSYDPAADADAVMDDFFLKFYGPKAGPTMKDYWMGIDRAFAGLHNHSGGIHNVHLVYTPEFLRRCRDCISRAAAASKGDETLAARVEMASQGLRNAEQYATLREAVNRGDFHAANSVFADMQARNEANVKTRQANAYTTGYPKRFLGKMLAAGLAATSAPNKLVAVLPDAWRFDWDEAKTGVEKGYQEPKFDDSKWREVATFNNTLNGQGLPDRQTVLWYRTTFQAPAAGGKLALAFLEVDGDVAVYVNGKAVGGSEKRRIPFEVDISSAAVSGRNVVAVRVDHTRMTEMLLGGIIRPVLLVEKGK